MKQKANIHPQKRAFALFQAPQLDINTVAAGGGSKLTFRSGCVRCPSKCSSWVSEHPFIHNSCSLFMVGPESARANPGTPKVEFQ